MMSHRRYIIFWLIILITCTRLGAICQGNLPQAPAGNLTEDFFNSLYNFSFHGADSIFNIMNGSNMNDITISNIKATLSWWKLLSGDAVENNIRICDSSLQESFTLSNKSREKDINTLLNIIYAYSLKARLENFRGNSLKSLIYFYRSFIYIKDCMDFAGGNEKVNLVFGLYLYFVDYIEDEYRILGAIFLPLGKGDKIRGMKYLHECSESDDEMVRTEATYFLFKIYAYTEKNYPEAYLQARKLTEAYPDNLIYGLEQYKLLLQMQRTYEAQIFQKKLEEEIRTAKNINSSQKSHFLSQLSVISKVPEI